MRGLGRYGGRSGTQLSALLQRWGQRTATTHGRRVERDTRCPLCILDTRWSQRVDRNIRRSVSARRVRSAGQQARRLTSMADSADAYQITRDPSRLGARKADSHPPGRPGLTSPTVEAPGGPGARRAMEVAADRYVPLGEAKNLQGREEGGGSGGEEEEEVTWGLRFEDRAEADDGGCCGRSASATACQ